LVKKSPMTGMAKGFEEGLFDCAEVGKAIEK
jgi:hypothetical protein